jgi:hypothetical protein
MIEQASLVIGNCNWANKEGSLLGYKLIDGKYYAREIDSVRATTATRINAQGLVELVPYNLAQYSEQFDNAYWSKINTTVTANAGVAPDGTTTADRLQINGGGFNYISRGFAALNTTVTTSIWVKANSVSNNTFRLYPDTITGTVFTATNEWQRISVTKSVINGEIRIAVPSNAAAVDILIWGAQLVEGSTAKDYQKTETRLNIPRLDYSNGTCPSLLVEPQRTNLLTYSSSFDNAAWTPQNISLTTNATTAPDGTTTADKIILNNGSQVNPVVYQISDTTANTRTLSFFAKASEYNIAFGRVGGAASAPIVLFSLTGSGSILHNQNVSAYSIEALANGWYRCSMTYAHGTAFAPNVGVCSATYSVSASNVTSTGNGTSGIFIWGAQLEVGSYATSYIPTTSASVTRNADVISKTGISSLIGQTEGTLFVDYLFNENTPNLSSNDNILLGLNDGTTNNLIVIIHYGSSASAFGKKIRFFVRTSGATQASIDSAAQTSGRYKVAITYASNSFKLFVNGVLIGEDTSGTVPATSAVYLYDFIANLGTLQNYINAAALWKTRLTNTQLAQLTTL